MSDSQRSLSDSVVVGNEGTLLADADLPVPPDPGPERQQPLGDPRHDPSRGTAAVLFERELPFEGIDDALDPLADWAQGAVASRLVLAIRAEQGGPQLGRSSLQEAVGKAFVADDDLAFFQRASIEERLCNLGFSQLRVGQTPVHDQAVGGGEQVELEAPEVAGTAGTGKRGGVQQAQSIAPGRRLQGEMAENSTENGRERPQTLVVAGLLGQVGEEMAQPHHGEAKPAVLGGAGEQDLGDARQANSESESLGLRPSSRP